MSNERQDDEILGRALARAIETIEVNQTPFERSRIATAPARRSIFGLWQIATAAAAIVLALAIGTWIARPNVGQPGVAASPTVAASPVPTVAPASAVPATSVPTWVYFARDGLPPVGAFVAGYPPNSSSREIAIDTRIGALRRVGPGEIPAGATNPLASVAPPQGGTSRFGLSVRIQGDLATVEFDLSSGWGVRGAAQSQALLQQLVYTITDEPGINRALITETGKPHAVIDQLVVDKPLSREDVFGYANPAKPDEIQDGGTGILADVVDWRASVDEVAPGLARFVVELKPTASTATPPMPRFTAQLERVTNPNDAGKWSIRVELPDAVWQQGRGEAFHCCPLKLVGTTPVRQLAAYPLNPTPLPGPGALGGGAYRGVGFGVALDDARPWRAFVLQNPLRLVIDIGGPPHAISDRIAVYGPRPGDTVTPDLRLSGAARVFEANVSWRLRDSSGRVVVNGHFNASLGSSAVWGTFDTRIQLPTSAAVGNVTLEVFGASPKDGSDQGLVQIPLTLTVR